MAAKLLLPGFGGQDTQTLSVVENGSEVFTTDNYDMSRMASFSVQVTSYTGDGVLNLRVQQTFDGTNWVDINTGAVTIAGTAFRFPASSQPFGRVRVGALATNSSNDTDILVLTLTGWPANWSN